MGSGQEMNTVLPYQFNNLIYIFICGLVLLWALKAISNFYRMLQIRNAVLLTDRVVLLDGIGSYLTYFEGAPDGHARSLVHTRQSKPPVDMSSMYIPCLLNKASSIGVSKKVNVNMEVSVTIGCTAYVVYDFKLDRFRETMTQEGRLSGFLKKDKIFASSKIGGDGVNMKFLNEHGCCQQNGKYQTLNAQSNNIINFEVSPDSIVGVIMVPDTSGYQSSHYTSDSLIRDRSDLEAAVHETTPVKGRGSSDGFKRVPIASPAISRTTSDENNVNPNADESTTYKTGFNLTSFFTNSMTTMWKTGAPSPPNPRGIAHLSQTPVKPQKNNGTKKPVKIDCTMAAGIFILKIQPTNDETSRKSLLPSDFLIIDDSCHVFSSVEIFGLSAVDEKGKSNEESKGRSISFSPTASPASKSASADADNSASPDKDKDKDKDSDKVDSYSAAGHIITAGGKFVEEECVVCLTENKEILLLPCRHLCVCGQCLAFIDKCPVCRATFEEYVRIGGENGFDEEKKQEEQEETQSTQSSPIYPAYPHNNAQDTI